MCKKTPAYFYRQKNARFVYSDLYFLQRLSNSYGFMKIKSAQYPPVSVEVGRENTEKYARLITTFFANVFQCDFSYAAFFTLRCKQTFKYCRKQNSIYAY